MVRERTRPAPKQTAEVINLAEIAKANRLEQIRQMAAGLSGLGLDPKLIKAAYREALAADDFEPLRTLLRAGFRKEA